MQYVVLLKTMLDVLEWEGNFYHQRHWKILLFAKLIQDVEMERLHGYVKEKMEA